MADFEMGRERLTRLLAERGDGVTDLNEAATRFQVIDILLNDVLGWPRRVIQVEQHEGGEFTDYELGKPPQLVIEAKREGKQFQLPAGWNKTSAKLDSLRNMSDIIEQSIDQVLGYSQKRGIPYAAICNGHQLIAFLGSRSDGIPPPKGKAIIYLSLADMLDRFDELWDSLSPPALASGRLQQNLAGRVLPPPPEKLAAHLPDYPGHKNRNPISVDLQILGGLFLEDITRQNELEDEFLAATYCKSGALSQYALIGRDLLQARYAATFSEDSGVAQVSVATKRGLSEEVLNDILAASLASRPILLVGDVGVGKSTFIRHFIRVDAEQELKRAFVFYMDLGEKPALADDLAGFIANEIARQARDDYGSDFRELALLRSVYRRELKSFERGIYSKVRETDPATYSVKEAELLEQLVADRDEHLGRCLDHAVQNECRQVVIFLDNIDQRPAGFQESAFLIAEGLARSRRATVFLTIRPETFAASRATGTLSAYQPRVFTIDPPRVDEVLRKRLIFAKTQLERTKRLPGMASSVTIESQNLRDYLDVLIRAFEQNQEIIEFLDNISGGNVRLALDFVIAFVGSGHVDSEKILARQRDGGYLLPLHEFLRAVIHGDGVYYDPGRSELVNLFDISSQDGKEHFLSPLMIAYVKRAGQIGGAEGYVHRDEVYSYAHELGYFADQTRTALSRCVHGRLLATPSGSRADDHSRVRVTTVGAYMVYRLMNAFTYVDAMIVDTPVVDPARRKEIQDARTLTERLDRMPAFLGYLTEQWSAIGALNGIERGFDWSVTEKTLRGQLDEIRERDRSRKETSSE